MATTITKYLDNAGKEFNSEAEADASNAKAANAAEVEAFVSTHFATKEGSTRVNPHASTAAKAIFLWLGSKQAA
jgi:hypothetical protein